MGAIDCLDVRFHRPDHLGHKALLAPQSHHWFRMNTSRESPRSLTSVACPRQRGRSIPATVTAMTTVAEAIDQLDQLLLG
jgi:hypothetical protein